MDAADRAPRTGAVAQQRLFSEHFAAYRGDCRITGLLEIVPGQRRYIIEALQIGRGAEMVVFTHHVGGGHLIVNLLEHGSVLLARGAAQFPSPLMIETLQILAPRAAPPPIRPKCRYESTLMQAIAEPISPDGPIRMMQR